jgi:lipoprotein NlpD
MREGVVAIVKWCVVCVALAVMTTGCASRRPAPVSDRTPPARVAAPPPSATTKPPARVPETQRLEFYTVKPGDTLYSIALDNGLDYRELAAWNNLDNVSVIRVGQLLRLTPPPQTSAVTAAPLKTPGGKVESRPLGPPAPAGATSASAPPAVAAASPKSVPPGTPDVIKTQPKAVRLPYSDQTLAQLSGQETAAPAKTEKPAEAKSEPVREPDAVDWMWPATGKIVTSFTDTANLKGIGIAGKPGQPVFASAPGKVVYSGSGLRGYGKLIIIKHNATYLSVYAHNSELLVKEGQSVSKGQKIAEMGNTDSDQVKLHFEIRRFGKPVDPLKLLPERAAGAG